MARVTPAAHVDRHQRWMSPGSRFMDTLVWLAVGLVVLMAGATAAVVILAARAGLEAHRETIEVLHMMGSTDIQVARLFQRRIALDTLAGGIVGTVVARSEEYTSELQSLMRNSYDVFCLKNKKSNIKTI